MRGALGQLGRQCSLDGLLDRNRLRISWVCRPGSNKAVQEPSVGSTPAVGEHSLAVGSLVEGTPGPGGIAGILLAVRI